MITENQVVASVAAYLEDRGYKIEQSLSTTERGVDIVAKTLGGKRCYIEAKGGTSSKKHTKKYGKPFSKGQAATHISVAILKAFQLSNKYQGEGTEVGIALPNDKNHLGLVRSIERSLKMTGLQVYLVDEKLRTEKVL